MPVLLKWSKKKSLMSKWLIKHKDIFVCNFFIVTEPFSIEVPCCWLLPNGRKAVAMLRLFDVLNAGIWTAPQGLREKDATDLSQEKRAV
jgi:hypothetical protein